jgi:erythromycin esterase-like protein
MFLAPLLAALLLAAPAGGRDPALDAAVRDLCGRDVAMLGEADHGDGRTIEFKVALVQALVRRCRFDAVFFEASHYDFLEFSRLVRAGEPVSRDMVAAAIGGLWRHDREMQPLVAFLFEEARAGRIALGGLDDQIGGMGAFFANDGLPRSLSAYLPAAERRAECGDLIRRRIYSDFGGRYGPAEKARIQACLADIGRALAAGAGRDARSREEALQMAASVGRQIARDQVDFATYPRERDRSMYLNFRWLEGRLPRRSKIIVWSATAHVARDASATRDFAQGPNFGAFVHRDYGRRAFALGFTALAGTHYWSRQEPARAFAAAAPGSLEARALAGSRADTVYLGPRRLQRLGALPGGALFYHEPMTLRWSDVLDGLVVFRSERPPQRIDRATP